MKDFFAIIASKVIAIALRICRRTGGSLPGAIALKISKEVLKSLTYPTKYIVVTGTNGKTGTTGIIRNIFQKAGFEVVSNIHGDNLIFGIATAILKNTNPFTKRVRADVIVLEVDELTLASRMDDLFISDVVITNLFPDQLDRYGTTDTLVKQIGSALRGFMGRVITNSDDPMLYTFHNVGFGICENVFTEHGSSEHDSGDRRGTNVFCPGCHGVLTYKYHQYGHVGDFHCQSCGLKRWQPKYLANIAEDGSYEVGGMRFAGSGKGLYHYYNELAAISVALEYGISRDVIEAALKSSTPGKGRMERFGDVLLNLVKNPVGLNQVISYISNENIMNDKKYKSLLFALSDAPADGMDVSWIWELNAAKLWEAGITNIICTGSRCYDAALLFKYSEYDFNVEADEDTLSACRKIMNEGGYAVSTYTALAGVRNCFEKIAAEVR